MKVIIAGGRDIRDYDAVKSAVEESEFTVLQVVSGAAKGVDYMGELWSEWRDVPCKRFPADWNTHGKAAGPIRNKQMAEYADALILVWDGKSRGSASMKREAIAAGLKIHEKIV